jgi:sucrose-phosphate synthase
LQDVVALDSSNIISVEGYSTDDLKSALQQMGMLMQ